MAVDLHRSYGGTNDSAGGESLVENLCPYDGNGRAIRRHLQRRAMVRYTDNTGSYSGIAIVAIAHVRAHIP